MLVDNEESTWMKSAAAQVHLPNGGLASSTDVQTMGLTRRVKSYISGSTCLSMCLIIKSLLLFSGGYLLIFNLVKQAFAKKTYY